MNYRRKRIVIVNLAQELVVYVCMCACVYAMHICIYFEIYFNGQQMLRNSIVTRPVLDASKKKRKEKKRTFSHTFSSLTLFELYVLQTCNTLILHTRIYILQDLMLLKLLVFHGKSLFIDGQPKSFLKKHTSMEQSFSISLYIFNEKSKYLKLKESSCLEDNSDV